MLRASSDKPTSVPARLLALAKRGRKSDDDGGVKKSL